MDGVEELSDKNKVNMQYMSLEDKFKKAVEASAQIGVPFTNPDGSYKPFIDMLQGWARVWEECIHDKNS